MKTYSIADASKYYRQNNNIIKPTVRCKPTETVEGLDLAGWPLPSGLYPQPEDNLTAWMEANLGPDSPEDWKSIAQAINGHFLPGPKPIIGPRWDWDFREALFGIVNHVPFAMSSKLTDAGHIVGLVEFTINDDKTPSRFQDIRLEDVTEIRINDPYGKKVNGKYNTALSGFRVPFTLEEFLKIWRATGIQIRRNK